MFIKDIRPCTDFRMHSLHGLSGRTHLHIQILYATFPSVNETVTTKRPQTSRVRDFNQTFCIQKFRDMHICSLEFKTMPWHAWFQNKIERYRIERYNNSRSIFLSTAHAFQCKYHIYFFHTIHHIDPLHRKQTLTLSQCNSRDLTDTFTHKSFYTQTVLHTDASTRRRFYTHLRPFRV